MTFEFVTCRFNSILQSSLQIELDYIEEALNRVSLKKGIVPIISSLYAANFGVDVIQDLIEYVGIPYTYTDNHEYHYPQSYKDPKEASADMIALIGQHALYNYLVHPNRYRCCPLRYMCLDTTFDKEECFDAPWLGHECSMTVMGKAMGISDKKLSW